uniref:NAD(P)(+)--arginine ADP-ribosyltransferase n=1 Tax=Xiphophorus couchianus TaxID=32473 RepID=A0A3B5L9N5_9TELE
MGNACRKMLHMWNASPPVSLSDVKLLDPTSPVIDDQYDGCRKEAMEKFTPDLLKEELGKSEKLQKAWKKWDAWRTSSNCTSQIPGGTEDHTSALSIYHYGDTEFLNELNNAVETMMVNVTTYEKDFHFKALHFLLMDSMMLLKPKECREVYFTKGFKGKAPEINSKVRLASFTVVDSDLIPYAVNTSINVFLLASCYLRWSIVIPHVCHQCKAKALSVQLSCFRRKCVSQQRRLDNGRGGATTSPFLRFGWQTYGSTEDFALRFSHYQCNKILVTLFQP